jgi:hypothetical protein
MLRKENFIVKVSGLLVGLILLAPALFAHDTVIDVAHMSGPHVAGLYFLLGFKHILPLGFDHILFILSLFLLSRGLKPILWQSATFTVAHSVTLGLSMYGVIQLPPAIVEPLIALSILYVALENIFSPRLKASRIIIVFLFGLIHGLGFAGVLQDLGLPEKAYLTSLLLFNAGVEIGQVVIILAAWFLVARWFRETAVYRTCVVIPLSFLIALTAGFWVIQRIFFQ